ncbi:conserved hypothetical protein [Alkaliphilus metalliredigens QYMF]|uniref:CobQ/CobB/MinD/ParA nucleotide binding domain-containing protein n=1 Tax=Alkaliphilus metalliredigens (strain QYMF) TaxID=293826 RepID=A6TW13_ALKMQ|nr:ATP-binding protein [Alkaliphilus metalliredigens]ABR50381.1 conserved hypothetical protein [Alkaliphilus metalliredigens QYMF]
MLKDNRVRIIIGHYGSGKTEFAVNYAIRLAGENKKVALADLDVVNPYFRSREKHSLLTDKGIKVISSYVKGSGSDLPAVSGAIVGPLQDTSYDFVLDVGGDSAGARTLARYEEYLKPGLYDMFCVVNANRPGTETMEDVISLIESIEATARAKVTGLINNTHLLRHTTLEDVLKGQELCKKVGEKRNIPIKYIAAIPEVISELPANLEGEFVTINMIMREKWM